MFVPQIIRKYQLVATDDNPVETLHSGRDGLIVRYVAPTNILNETRVVIKNQSKQANIKVILLHIRLFLPNDSHWINLRFSKGGI